MRVLDDAYNANADSMLAALETLRALPCPGRRVAVLGDMAELGESSGPAHAEVGRRAAELGLDQLFAIGARAAEIAAAARGGGLRNVVEFLDVGRCGAGGQRLCPAGRRGAGQGLARHAAGTHHRNLASLEDKK